MTEEEAGEYVEAIRKWLVHDEKKHAGYNVMCDHFATRSFNGKAYIAPVSFEKIWKSPGWKGRSQEYSAMTRFIERMDEQLEKVGSRYLGEMCVSHIDRHVYLILGREEVKRFKSVIRRRKVSISMKPGRKSWILPVFKNDDLIHLRITSQEPGWLHFFLIEGGQEPVIKKLYPGRGLPSEIRLSQNNACEFSEKINLRRDEPWRFKGHTEGIERIMAVAVNSKHPVPVETSDMMQRFPYATLFSHLETTMGMDDPLPNNLDTRNDFSRIKMSDITWGVCDYYYEG